MPSASTAAAPAFCQPSLHAQKGMYVGKMLVRGLHAHSDTALALVTESLSQSNLVSAQRPQIQSMNKPTKINFYRR